MRLGSHDHNHGPDGRHLSHVVTTELYNKKASRLYEAGGHSLGAVVRYMEPKQGLRINIRCLLSRSAAQREKKRPRASEAARLIQALSVDQVSEALLRSQVKKVGLNDTL